LGTSVGLGDRRGGHGGMIEDSADVDAEEVERARRQEMEVDEAKDGGRRRSRGRGE
jgi:hypothetical protein